MRIKKIIKLNIKGIGTKQKKAKQKKEQNRKRAKQKKSKTEPKRVKGQMPFIPALFQRTEAEFPDKVHRWK